MRKKLEDREAAESANSFKQDRLEVVPTLGMTLGGSIYHPNLLDFRLVAEAGVSWEDESLEVGPAGPSRDRVDTNPLQLYNLNVRILKEKPYAVWLFAEKSEIRRDNDFFSRLTLDRERYGAQAGFSGWAWPFSLTVAHVDEEESDTTRPRTLTEDDVQFTMANRRPNGRTRFLYTYEDYIRRELGVPTLEGIRQYASLTDSQSFRDEMFQLVSDLQYNDLDSSTVPSRTETVREQLTVRHTERLWSEYDYLFARRESGAARSTTHEGIAALHHQLYESLASKGELEYRTTEESGRDTERYGVGLDELYTKRLGEVGRLRLGVGSTVRAEERTARGGSVAIIRERHVLVDGRVTLLDVPFADPSSVVVTDPTGTVVYRETLDYLLIPSGAATEIRRVFGGDIPEGGTVLVSYTAAGEASDRFTTVENNGRIRLDLFDHLLSLYARIHTIDHYGAEFLTLQEVDERIFGVETSLGWLRAGAEYQDYDSNLLPFTTVRLFEHLRFRPSQSSMFSLNLDQAWTDYPETDEQLRTESYLANYHIRVLRSLALRAGAGLRRERGRLERSLDRDILTAHTGLDYWIGRTTVQASYDFRGEDYLAEDRDRHLFSLRVERTF